MARLFQLSLLHACFAASAIPPLEIAVDCATSSLHAARDSLRAAFASFDSAGSARPRARVLVTGPCHLTETLSFDARDSGDVTWEGSGAQQFLVTGGAAVAASSFEPVTDPSVLSQLPMVARAAVRQLNLAALSLPAGPAPFAGRECRQYAEGLPQPHGGSMPSAEVNSPTGLELFASTPGSSVATPLVLARWPNNPWLPANWSKVLHSAPPTDRTCGPDPVTLARSESWAQQFAEDPGSIYVHQYNRLGWADMHWRLTGLSPNRNFTFGGCGNMSVGEHILETGNYFYSYNILSEIDEPGEYYVNRTSSMLYAWLPQDSAPDANGTLAWASLLESPILELDGTVGAQWVGATFQFGRGAGVVCKNCSHVSFLDCGVANVGLMAVNVSDGDNVRLVNLSVTGTGNGGVYFYAGDRMTLTPANHTLSDSSVTSYNRYTHCYTPGVVLGGVGNVVSGTRIFDAPHNAIFLSGNEHTIEGCDISAVTRIVSDSGAFYMGRDLTYRGNRLINNSWHDINSVNPGTPILYLDDCASSITAINNSFRNCSGPAAALEGGKGHVFINNYIHEDAHGVHAVGKSCAGALPYLDLVPWNTSTVWLERYPDLVPEILENSGAPWHIFFVNNTLCAPRANSSAAAPFVDMSNSTASKYNGSIDEGYNACVGPASIWTGSPVRGFNSWTAFGCGVTDADLRQTADALVETGLARFYTFVGIDDCWAKERDADGRIQPDPVSFPNGMLAVSEYVRSRGLSFAIYTAIGNQTCAHRPGSAGYEALDAESYASWHVTWLKLDNCDYPGWEPAILYDKWSAALDAQPYRIPLASKAVLNFSESVRVAASRRVGGDVSASWRDLLGLAYMAEPLWAQARAGSAALGQSSFWTDVELLQVGNGHLSANETAAHFYLWVALHAPLVLSTRISSLSAADISLLSNPELLSVNEDALGSQAHRVALQEVTAPQPPLAPLPLACSNPGLVAPGQSFDVVALPPPRGNIFSLRLRSSAASLCLQRVNCTDAVTVDVCPPPGTGCESGAGALWTWTANGGLASAAADGKCLNMEPALSVTSCHDGAAYQTLTYINATGQIMMNFTGSGALGDYTGYPQCVDALPLTHAEIWASQLENGDLLVLTLNPTTTPDVDVAVDISLVAVALGRSAFSGIRALRDVGLRENITAPQHLAFNLSTANHSARIVRVTPT